MTRFVGTPLRGIEFANNGDEAISTRIVGDAHAKIRIDAGGRITWSSGSASGDTNLYRDSANVLKTDDVFYGAGGIVTIATDGAPTAALSDGAMAVDVTNNVFYFRSDGEWVQVSNANDAATITISPTAPGSPEQGELWFDSDDELLKIYNSSSWVNLTGAKRLTELADVDLSIAPVDGDFLKYSSSASAWVSGSAEIGGATVTISVDPPESPEHGDLWFESDSLDLYIYYNDAFLQLTDSSSGVTDITDLGDVLIDDPLIGQVLKYNGAEWINETLSASVANINDIGNVQITSASVSQVLQFDGTNWVNTTFSGGAADTDELPEGLVNLYFTVARVLAALPQDISASANPTFATVNADLSGNATTATALETSRSISLGGDLSGSASFDGSTDVTITATIQPDSVALGADTTGDYVQNLVAGTNVALTNNSGEGATPTVTVSGDLTLIDSISTPDYIQFDPTHVVTTASAGRLQWSADEGTLELGLEGGAVNLPIGAKNVIYVKNGTGNTIAKAKAVMAVGASGDRINIGLAVADGSINARFMLGVTAEEIIDDSFGYVVTDGYVRNLNTNSWVVGTVLYFDPDTPGNLTSTQPSSPDLSLPVAIVTKQSNTAGIIYVRMTLGDYFGEAHDVLLTTPASGDFLKYNGSLWVNDSINLGTDTEGNYLSSITAGTGIDIVFTPGEDVGASVSLNASLDDLNNVTVPSPSSGDLLKWNGSAWINEKGVAVADTAPASPQQGDLWYESDTGKLFTYYDSFWVQIGGAVGAGGPPGVVISDVEPTSTGVLWADTGEVGTAVLPAGGSAGQVLVKASGTAYDTGWTSDYLLEQPRGIPDGGAAFRGVPGVMVYGLSGDAFAGGTVTRYYPFVVHRPLTITEAAINVTGNAFGQIDCYILPADSSWQPIAGSAVTIGQFDTSTTGVKTLSGLSIVLSPGRYLGELTEFGTTSSNVIIAAYNSLIPGITTIPDALTANGGSFARMSTSTLHQTWNVVNRYSSSSQSIVQGVLYRWTES